jgi:hypothetical protein
MARTREPERWWNAIIQVTLPFDTAEEAQAAVHDGDTADRLIEVFGDNAVISGRIEEAVEGVWPY